MKTKAEKLNRNIKAFQSKPITLSLLGSTLAACGTKNENNQQFFAPAMDVVRFNTIDTSYFGNIELKKLIIDSESLNNLSTEWDRHDPPRDFACKMIPPTEGTIKIGEKGAVSISSPKGCWGDGYVKSASFEAFEIIELNNPLANFTNYYLEAISVNLPGSELLITRYPMDSINDRISYISNENILYISQLTSNMGIVTTEIDKLVLGGPIFQDLNFTDGPHKILIDSEDVFSNTIQISNLGQDDELLLARHLLSLMKDDEIFSDYNEGSLQRFTSVEGMINASQVLVDTEENILNADLRELLEGDLDGGLLAFSTDTAKLFFDTDGDFSNGTVEVFVFTDGVLPHIEVIEMNFVI